MERIKLLNAEEAEKYYNFVERLGKAKGLSAAERDKYQKAYLDIVNYLNQNFKGYLMYCITSGTNKVSEAAFMSCVDHATKCGLFDRIKESLQAGDAVEFGFRCKALEVVYKSYENESRKAQKAINEMMRVG